MVVSTSTLQLVVGTRGGLRQHDSGGDPFGGAPITAVHPDGDHLWVLVQRDQLHRLTGEAVELVASLEDGGAGICVGTHAGIPWVGGDDARLWRLRGGRLAPVESFQEAPTHEEWHTPWGGPPAVFSMASNGSELYVSVHVGGILKTSDGESWRPTIDLHDDVHQVAVGDDGTVWAATGRRGLAESTDGGATWRYHTDGLHAHYLLAVTPVTDGALVGASSGHAGRDGAVYRFDGRRFTPGRGLPDALGGAVGPRQLAAAGDDAVVALNNGDIYVSHDGGREWTPVMEHLPDVSEVTIAGSRRHIVDRHDRAVS
jgi:hypothetical protein